ncbi:MAG: hypothetical protein ACI4XM_04595 [Candidatus Coprovivens sp.]
MKDVVKTFVVVLVVLVVLTITFLVVGNAKYGYELLTTTKLDEKDPTAVVLYDRIKDKTDLRKAEFLSEDLTSEEIVHFVIDNLTKNDYNEKIYEHEKIVCQVTKTIKFTSSTDCKIRIIDNSVFSNYQKKYFISDNEINFDDFNYHGYDCKNDGKRYYCLIDDYTNTVFGYSSYDSAYKSNNQIAIREYYLQIDLRDINRCINYFGEEFCSNYKGKEKPSLSDKTIKQDGVLYEHIFLKEDESFYLISSSIVNEG